VRLAYITTYDPRDRRNWSGLGYAIMRALVDQKITVDPLGPLQTKCKMIGRLKGAFYRKLFGSGFEYERGSVPTCGFAREINVKLYDNNYDVVLSTGSIPVSRLQCRQPIVIWADSTFASYIRHYGLVRTLSRETIRAGHVTERHAYGRSSLLIFASEWAAKSAIADYGVDAAEVKVVPFGANFENPPNRQAVFESIYVRPPDRCQLITIGVDWNRKGVPRTIELSNILNNRGIPTTLSIVGCYPPVGVSVPEFVNVEGFIDKHTVNGEQKISQLLLSSHFHVLFSTAEAFGVVFAEANAHGVPNIASDVGGIGTAVVNGCGGQRFNLGSSLSEVADYIERFIKDRPAYVSMALRARREFDERLNWDVSGAQVRRYLYEIVEQRKRTHREVSLYPD
jgi:glycosyltransferase involved in cell wall biosynthesis